MAKRSSRDGWMASGSDEMARLALLQTILSGGHIRSEIALHVEDLRVALVAMVERGEIEPLLGLFHSQVLQTFSNRDLRGLDEKTIKLLLMTYASLGRAFYPLSEREFAQGYGDLFLSASRTVAGANFSWLLELKYLKTDAKPAQIEAAFAEAAAQVKQYSTDPALLPLLLAAPAGGRSPDAARGEKQLKAGMLVFIGAKKVLFRPWDPSPAVGQAAASDAKPAPTKPKRTVRKPRR